MLPEITLYRYQYRLRKLEHPVGTYVLDAVAALEHFPDPEVQEYQNISIVTHFHWTVRRSVFSML